MTDLKGFNGCRVCLGRDTNQEMIPIFGDISINLFLISSIKIISKVDYICNNCNLQLANAIQFREMCIESDKNLRENWVHIKQEVTFKKDVINSTTLACDKSFEKVDTELTKHKLEPQRKIKQSKKSSEAYEVE